MARILNVVKFMKKKKLLIIVNRFYPEVGGAELNTYKQSLELAKEFEVTVVCPERTLSSLSYKDKTIKIIRLLNFLNLARRFPYQKSNTLCFRIFFIVLFGSYDSVLCFPAPSHNSFLALLACKIRRISCILVSFDLHDYSNLLEKGINLRTGLDKLGGFSKVRKFFVQRFSHIFAISNREINFYQKFNKSVSYCPVAIDFSDYKEAVIEKSREGKIEIVMIGRVSHIKGQDIGLEGFEKLIRSGVDASLRIIGRTDFEPEFYKSLQRKVIALGLQDHVEFLGNVSREQLLKSLREAHIHLIPVRFMNSGAVVVESLASETFVVQSDMVDPSVVKEGVDGLTFSLDSGNDLGEKLKIACSLVFTNRLEMKEARERVLDKFNYSVLANILKEKLLREPS